MRKIINAGRAVILVLIVVNATVFTGCRRQEAHDAPELIDAVGVDMDTVQVMRMDLSGVVSYSAQVVPRIEEISFLSSGSIDKLKVSVGDYVKKGQLLATLSGNSDRAKQIQGEIKNLRQTNEDVNKQSRYDIEMLEEKVRNLGKKRKSVKKTSEKKQLDKQIMEGEEDIKLAEERLRQQKELQRLEIRQKEEEMAEARESVKSSKLYSPINGEVVSTTGGSGYMVQGGNTAFQIANMEAFRLKTVYVSSTEIAKASRYVAVLEGKEYEIQIEEQEISREDIEKNKYPTSSTFDFISDHVDAKVGDSATINLYKDSVEDALVVPSNAVFGNGSERYVYVVNGDAKTKVSVTTGTKTDAYVQIKTGVKEGDIVYVEG